MDRERVPVVPGETCRQTEADDARDGIGSLARELGRAYLQLVENHRRAWDLSPADADAQLRLDLARDGEDAVVNEPPDEISWGRLAQLVEADPEAGYRLWQQIQAEARAELASGHRAASVLDFDGTPWERARFLALRTAFQAEWQPRGGIEEALIDTLALAYSNYLLWLERLDILATSEGRMRDHALQEQGVYLTPRVSVAQSLEQAAGMADRFNRMFTRTLRALRDLRRYNSPVIVQHARQVNVAEQQIVTTGGVSPAPE